MLAPGLHGNGLIFIFYFYPIVPDFLKMTKTLCSVNVALFCRLKNKLDLVVC